MPFVLSLDEGTTSARAALYDERGRRVALEAEPLPCEYPQPGWVEQDADSIWQAQLSCARRLLNVSGVPADEVTAIGITNQRETTIVWERATGRPIAPAIVWQCRRTTDMCRSIALTPGAESITRATGLIVDPYFSASKICWILDSDPESADRARDGELLFGTVDTWLVWKLTNGALHLTDVTNASRTMLMNLATGDWDAKMLDLFDIPRAMLPSIVPSSSIVANAAPEHFGVEIPIAGIAGDQQAALFGQACFRPGLAKNTYGTGCFALEHTGGTKPVSQNRLVATRAAQPGAAPEFALEGSVFTAGAAVQWLRDQLGLIHSAAESEQLAASVDSSNGVCFVPAFSGLGAPYWDSSARGLVTGITAGATRAHIVRAALEAIAYQTRDLIQAMEADSGQELAELRADGGAANNNFLMQFQADILGKPVVRPADVETTALGAAFLAGLATGFWSGADQLESFWRAERTFSPAMPASQREDLYAAWKQAVSRARS